MPAKRIFVAVDISEDARRVAAAYIGELRERFKDVRVGWERPEKLHFTLKFLGDVDERRISEVETTIAAVATPHGPFDATLSGTGVFPNAREPRVLWLGIGNGKADMVSLGTEMENALSAQGFVKENRLFSPHMTVGRVREPRKGKKIAAEHLSTGFQPVGFAVDRLTIYESKLSQRGRLYEVLSEIPL